MASFSFIVPMCADAEVSKQASAPEEVCLPLFLLPFHSHTFLLLLYLLVLCLLGLITPKKAAAYSS